MRPWQRTPREPDSQTCKLCSERIIWPHIGQNHLAALSFTPIPNNIYNIFTRFSIFFSLISIFLIYSPHIGQNHLATLSIPSNPFTFTNTYKQLWQIIVNKKHWPHFGQIHLATSYLPPIIARPKFVSYRISIYYEKPSDWKILIFRNLLPNLPNALSPHKIYKVTIRTCFGISNYFPRDQAFHAESTIKVTDFHSLCLRNWVVAIYVYLQWWESCTLLKRERRSLSDGRCG